MGFRRLLSLSIFVFALGTIGGVFTASAQSVDLRLMAANLSSGNYQSYDPGEGINILQGIDPDVVLIQEFNYGDNSTTAIRGFVTQTFDSSYSYFREAGAQIPNGIISRYPILRAGEWDDTAVSNRDFAYALIDVPGDIDLFVVSVHLLTTSATNRNTEATALQNLIKMNAPADAYVAIGGDFNVSTRGEAAIATLSSVVVTSGPYPKGLDASGMLNENTNAGRKNPFDAVYVSSNLNVHATATVVGNSSFANGLVVDTRYYSTISELSPAKTSDSAASGMQHMGVVRDFVLSVPEPSAIWFFTTTSALLLFQRARRSP